MGRPSCPRFGRRGHVSTGRSGGGATVGETRPVALGTPEDGVPGEAAVAEGAPLPGVVAPAATLTVPVTLTTLPVLVSPAGAAKTEKPISFSTKINTTHRGYRYLGHSDD